MKVVGLQSELVWHERAANRAMFDEQLAAVPDDADLVILPEMFTTGFTMAGLPLAEPEDGPTLTWMRDWARRLGGVVTGSFIVAADRRPRNRLLWVRPDGSADHYDKRHLFRMAGEHEVYAEGKRRAIFDCGMLRVLVAVCYDLRFPVWARNRGDYDLYLVVANWPAARQSHWRTLLRARAIENQCFAIGVNRVGVDGNDVAYAGGSVAFGPEGEVLAECGDGREALSVTLDRTALDGYRERFPAWMDADEFVCSSPQSDGVRGPEQ